MERLDLRSVNWQPGMLIRHPHLSALDQHSEALAHWILRHTSPYGVVRPAGSMVSPIELDIRLDRTVLAVRLLRCLAITPGGGIVDIQPKSELDARLLPEARIELESTVSDSRIPVIVEITAGDKPFAVGEPEEDGRMPWLLPGYALHLDTKVVTDRAWSLQVAEVHVHDGRAEESSEYFPPTPYVQAIPAMQLAFNKLHEKADRIRDLLVNHLGKYAPHHGGGAREFAIQRGTLSDLLHRISALDRIRPAFRHRTPPDEAFAVFAALLDGFRAVLESNSPLFEAVRRHYVDRQPPVHPQAVDFIKDLLSVRSWRFDPESVGRHVVRISGLLDHFVYALDEPVTEMMGVGVEVKSVSSDVIEYKGKPYQPLDPTLVFTDEWLELADLPATVINQILVRFPSAEIPQGQTYGAQFAVDFRTIFDFHDATVDMHSSPGYCCVLMQIARVVHQHVRLKFDPLDPYVALRRMQPDFKRRWHIGYV